MTTNNQMGTCALCGKENIQLMQSHLIPKAVYKRIKTFKNSRFREMDDIQKIYQDGEKKPMLCHDCEELFSKYERDFCNTFLDKYTADKLIPSTITQNINFYLLTVSWRILYDDLYVYDSFKERSERTAFERLEYKIRRYLNSTHSPQQQELIDQQLITNYANGEPQSFGEAIAFIENIQKLQLPEDISEIKNYIFSLCELGYTAPQIELLSHCVTGYSFSTTTKQHYCVITSYLGWIFLTVYQPKRYIQISLDTTPYDKSITDIVKEETNYIIQNIVQKSITVQKQLDETGLREKIKKRYSSQ